MIAGVVYATLDAAPRDDQIRMDTRVVLLAPQEQQNAADPPPVQLADALPGFQPVAVSVQIPIDVPPVDLQQRFDPKDYSGSGVEGSRKSTRLNSSHSQISYAVFCLKKKKKTAAVWKAIIQQGYRVAISLLPAVVHSQAHILHDPES